MNREGDERVLPGRSPWVRRARAAALYLLNGGTAAFEQLDDDLARARSAPVRRGGVGGFTCSTWGCHHVEQVNELAVVRALGGAVELEHQP